MCVRPGIPGSSASKVPGAGAGIVTGACFGVALVVAAAVYVVKRQRRRRQEQLAAQAKALQVQVIAASEVGKVGGMCGCRWGGMHECCLSHSVCGLPPS